MSMNGRWKLYLVFFFFTNVALIQLATQNEKVTNIHICLIVIFLQLFKNK